MDLFHLLGESSSYLITSFFFSLFHFFLPLCLNVPLPIICTPFLMLNHAACCNLLENIQSYVVCYTDQFLKRLDGIGSAKMGLLGETLPIHHFQQGQEHCTTVSEWNRFWWSRDSLVRRSSAFYRRQIGNIVTHMFISTRGIVLSYFSMLSLFCIHMIFIRPSRPGRTRRARSSLESISVVVAA